MVLPDHVCPFGLKAKDLLEANGFEVEDRQLTSRQEVDDFMEAHGLSTTPLILIGGKPIGGSDDLERYLAENSEAASGA